MPHKYALAITISLGNARRMQMGPSQGLVAFVLAFEQLNERAQQTV